MKALKYILFFSLLLTCFVAFSQQDSIRVQKQTLQLNPAQYNPLSPSKAAFYSAIFPGAGQIYNNRYWWQLPAIYGGLAASIYYYTNNDKAYSRYRTAFKQRSAGLPDEFDGKDGRPLISSAGLENAQKQTRKNRDLSLFSAILVYVLQIVEASVRAHLLQFNTNDNLSIKPTTIPDPNFQEFPKVGFSVKYNF